MNWKYFWVVLGVLCVVLGMTVVVNELTSETELPPGVSTTTPPIPSVTPTTTTPTVTVATTVTKPTWPTETMSTINPPPPVGCEFLGHNTVDWNTDDDYSDRGAETMADGNIAALAPTSSDCFDTIVLTVYDDLRNNPEIHKDLAENDPVRYEWVKFLSGYIDGVLLKNDPVGSVVPMNSEAVLHLTVFANAEAGDLLPLVSPGTPSAGQPADYRFVADSNFVSLHEIAWAGSFERITNFGIGVNGKTPFAVEYGRVTMDVTEVIIRIAHE